MEPLTAVLVGVLYGAGLYLLFSRNLVRVLLGIALLSHAANLLVFVAGGLTRGQPPIVGDAAMAPGSYADPLPQALILTAIVIGFGVFAFTLVLVRCILARTQGEDVDALTTTES